MTDADDRRQGPADTSELHPDPAPAAAAAPREWDLRPATIADVEEIAFLELELFPHEAWTVFQIAEEVEHPDRHWVVARSREDGTLLGYAGAMVAGDTADLHTIGTSRPGRGIGRALLAWCEEHARAAGAARMMLEVREDNERARAVYTRALYVPIARRRGYYRIAGRSIDAIVMERGLIPGPSVTGTP